MVGLQLSAFVLYFAVMMQRCCTVLCTANWSRGFLWQKITAEQQLANSVLLLLRLKRQVRVTAEALKNTK